MKVHNMPSKRPWCRAKIFQPFDALPGYRELLRQKEIEHKTRYDEHGNEKHEPKYEKEYRPRILSAECRDMTLS